MTIGTEAVLATTNASAVVSLSRIGTDERRPDGRHVEAWLVDSDDSDAHNDLAYALHDAADATQELLAAGETVFLHCVRAEHRTPSVALLHAVKYGRMDVDEAAATIRKLPEHNTIGGLLWATALEEARNAR